MDKPLKNSQCSKDTYGQPWWGQKRVIQEVMCEHRKRANGDLGKGALGVEVS